MNASHEWEWMGHFDRAAGDEARVQQFDAEERKEREWHELAALAKDFVDSHGAAAMLRCISEALR